MSTGVIKIPVLFDMSGDSIVFGEEVSGDFVSSHLDFLLDMTTEANDISLNAANISSSILIGDQDTGDNIFYSGGATSNIAVDNLCNRIAKAVTRGKLVHVPKSGDNSNSGIPMGGRASLVNALGEEGSLYATKYLTSIAPIGDEQMLGQAMARVASIHLVGSPLSAGIFQDANQIQTDLETASGQTFNSGGTAFYNALSVQLSKVLGGSKSSAPMNSGSNNPLDASGVACPALKSIYEQLMNVPGRSQIMQTRDISGAVDNSNTTLTGEFPFIAGDKLVMYLRPKIVFAAQTHAEQTTTLIGFPNVPSLQVPAYDIGRKNSDGGALSGHIYTQSSRLNDNDSVAFHNCFEGQLTDDPQARWMTKADDNAHKYSRTSPHAYTGPQNTTNVDGSTTLNGEWGQVDIGQNTVINKFDLWPRKPNQHENSPANFSLLGSLNGTSWTTIKQVTGETNWGAVNTGGLKSYTLGSVKGPYRYYRLSVQNLNGNANNDYLVLSQLVLHGAKHPSEITEITSAGIPTAQPTTLAITDISGLITNVTATAANIETAFPGNAIAGSSPETNKWGWVGSPNSTMLTLETTDENNIRTIDLHIWKITITL